MLNYIKSSVVLSVILIQCINVSGNPWFMSIEPLNTHISEIEELRKLTPKLVSNNELLFKIKEGNLFLGLL